MLLLLTVAVLLVECSLVSQCSTFLRIFNLSYITESWLRTYFIFDHCADICDEVIVLMKPKSDRTGWLPSVTFAKLINFGQNFEVFPWCCLLSEALPPCKFATKNTAVCSLGVNSLILKQNAHTFISNAITLRSKLFDWPAASFLFASPVLMFSCRSCSFNRVMT